MVRSEIISLRSERDKFNSEANVAREKLESFMKEVERQVIFFAGVFFPLCVLTLVSAVGWFELCFSYC